MTTALVMAGNSFVGRHPIRRLWRAGVSVAATARRPEAGFLCCDVTNPLQVEAAVRCVKPCWVIQCAGATTATAREEMDRLHLGATCNVLGAVARHTPDTVVVLFGSAAEYGNVPEAALPIH